MVQGKVLWFTGLSGAGKTTLATCLLHDLRRRGRLVELLDGDELRKTICSGLGFTPEDRLENVKRVAFLSNLLSRNGVTVLVSMITPYQHMRDYCRAEVGGYTEIYVSRPLEECAAADVKGLYAKAGSGEISHFTGISDPYEEPLQPDLVLNTSIESVEQSAEKITKLILQQERFKQKVR
ncbi:MAG TPA: adenylyl-sulfate kinase [Bacilli bacterium]